MQTTFAIKFASSLSFLEINVAKDNLQFYLRILIALIWIVDGWWHRCWNQNKYLCFDALMMGRRILLASFMMEKDSFGFIHDGLVGRI